MMMHGALTKTGYKKYLCFVMITLAIMLFSGNCLGASNPFISFVNNTHPEKADKETPAEIDIQAHRGGRDLYPENTLTAFRHAASLGVRTLELDTALTADDVVVISHDPYLSNKLVRDSEGEYVSEYPKILIKDLSYEELLTYKVGKINPSSSYARSHKTQKPVENEHIPTLSELFEAMDELNYHDICYNIEIKSYPEFPQYTKKVSALVDKLMAVINAYGKEAYCSIQSFDWSSLQIIQEHYPQMKTACLTAKGLKFEGRTFNFKLNEAGPSPWLAGFDTDDYPTCSDIVAAFGADIVSPYYKDITKRDVDRAHELGLKIIPWTVNKTDKMEELISWGVDGIITDRPDLLLDVTNQ